MPGEIAQAICSVAWLIGELEEETVAKATRSTMNDHIDLLNIKTKSLLDEIRVTISEEVEKQIGTFNMAATKLLEDKGTRSLSYHDMAVTNNTSLLFFSNMCLPYALYFYLSEHEFTYRNT
jgi:hypothetical protein